MRKRIAEVVEEAGHEVVALAEDGEAGFDAYRKYKPEIVIMDITMRGTDGIRGVELIKVFDPHANIIFMTMVQDEKVIERARELGAVGFLGKNEHGRLVELIGEVVGQEVV